MSLKKIITNQFEKLLETLTEAENELLGIDNTKIKSIKADIDIAKNRITEFKNTKEL